MKKVIIFFIAIIFLTGCAEKPTASLSVSVQTPVSAGIPIETIASHNEETGCWVAVNNNVFNITDYLSAHPQKDNIIKNCGKEATEFFEKNIFKNDEDFAEFQKYYIGDLKR